MRRFKLIIILLLVFLQLGCIYKRVSKEVLEVTGVENLSRLTKYETAIIKEVYMAEAVNDKAELIQLIEEKGFKDTIRMLVTIDTSTDRLNSLIILEHKETSEYGGYVSDDWFLNRFKEKNASKPLVLVMLMPEADNEIVAITGATKTSQAVIHGVNAAFENYMKIKGEVKK